ncbi:MAG: BspA family leucine-rich repeat surface protein, partial [Treponema sp.]|nr:BspA family leucine-rich repeat surface protein [Treponema sp.]
MKKIRKISACLLLVFASSILYFGCNQLLLEKPEEKENTSSSANSTVENATLSLSIKSIGSKKAARTIKPVFSDDNISSITLTGKKDGATTETTLGSWDTPSELQAASVSIEPGSWDFTLSLLMNGCSFSGTASEVISSGDDISLSFELSSSVTYGGIDFTLFLNGSAEYIEATLYDINGSEVVEPTVLSVEVSGAKTYIHYTRDINSSSEQLAIGTYRLKINFFTYSDKALMQNSYSAIVNVAAGFVSSAEQTINLNDIYKVSYNLDGGELPAGALMPERYSSISETIILVEPEKENFVFDGWYTTSTFTGEPVTKIAKGSSGDTILYAKFVSPYAYIGDTAYASLSKLVAAISNADSNEDITISLTSNVTQENIGNTENSETIAYAITNTTANSVSLLVPAAEKIEFSGDCSYMFKNCSKLVSVDFSGVDTYNASEIYGMFYGCSNLASVNLSGFDTSNVTNMMFMFAYCSKLETVDLSNFNTSSATSIHGMFSDCTSLTDVNLSSFDTSQADSFTGMFTNCTALT